MPTGVTVASSGRIFVAFPQGETKPRSPSAHLFFVPGAMLQDRTASDNTIAEAVVDLGEKGASDGLEADDQGRVDAGDYEHDSIRRRQTDGTWTTIAQDPRDSAIA